MEKKFITLRGLKEVLSDRELKNVLGGSSADYCGNNLGTSCSGSCLAAGHYCRYTGTGLGGLAICQCQP